MILQERLSGDIAARRSGRKMWKSGAVAIDLLDDLSGEGITTLLIRTPAGALVAMGSPWVDGRRLTVEAAHIQGLGIGENSIGPANLKALAGFVMERLGYDELIIRGALRTAGAVPGRRPGDIRFARRDRPPGGA